MVCPGKIDPSAMNPIVCFCAALLHYTFRLTAFVEPLPGPTKNNSIPTELNPPAYGSTSIFPSTLVFVSICILLADSPLFPERYVARSPLFFRLSIEFIAAFMLLEIGMILIWSRLEQLIAYTICVTCCGGSPEVYAEKGGDALTTMVLLAISKVLLVNTLVLTDVGAKLRKLKQLDTHDWRLKIAEKFRRSTQTSSSRDADVVSKFSEQKRNKKYWCLLCKEKEHC